MASSHAAVAPIEACAAPLTLSDEQARAWREDGFLACHQLLSAEELADVHAALRSILTDVASGALPREHVFYETPGDASTLKQVQALHVHSPALAELATRGPPATLAAALLGVRPVLQNVQLFSKPPRGQPTPPHQDAAYFLLRDPASAVTLWLALDDADAETGSVAYVRGSHLGGLRPHTPSGVLGFSRGLTEWTAADAQALLVQCTTPGDVLVHHGLTIHRAGANVSANRQRRAIGFIFYASGAEVDEAARAAYHEKLHADLAAAGRI